MRPVLFNSKYPRAHPADAGMIGFYHLVIATVHTVKRIFQSLENGLIFSILQHVYGKNAESS
jgi:hypothetical protein